MVTLTSKFTTPLSVSLSLSLSLHQATNSCHLVDEKYTMALTFEIFFYRHTTTCAGTHTATSTAKR